MVPLRFWVLFFALVASVVAQPLESPVLVKTLTEHTNESRVPWSFSLLEMPSFSNFHYKIKIEDPLEGVVQEIDIRNGVKLKPEDFELGGFRPSGQWCLRVKGGVSEGKVWYKTWVLDREANRFVFSPEV